MQVIKKIKSENKFILYVEIKFLNQTTLLLKSKIFVLS